MAKKDRDRGKALERWVGSRLGWRRRRAGETANGFDDNVQLDGSLTPVSVECKAYAVLQLRTAWIEQAETNAGGRDWMIVQRPKGRTWPIVSMDWRFAERLLRTARVTNQKEEEDGESQGSGSSGAH